MNIALTAPLVPYLSHRQSGSVQLLSEVIVVLIQRVTEQVVRKVEEGQAVEGAEDVDDLCPVGDEVVCQVQLPHVFDLGGQREKVSEPFNVVVVEGHERREHASLRLWGT